MRRYGVHVFLGCLQMFMGCQELLPKYVDPRNVLSATISGEYALTEADNSMNVYLTVRNTFDETLQGFAVLDGSIEINLVRIPGVEKTVRLSPSDLIQSRQYNPVTGEITLDPGDSIRLFVKWNWITDSGIDLRRTVFQYREDLHCNDAVFNRCVAEETFEIKGSVKVFENIPKKDLIPLWLSVRIVSRYIKSNYCIPEPEIGSSRCIPESFDPIADK